MYRAAICDDEEGLARLVTEKLNAYKAQHGIGLQVDVYTDSCRLLERIEGGELDDLYILDIRMPLCNGMELLQKIYEKGTTSQVILLTGYEEYAIEACGMAAGYVMKDALDERLPEALERAFRNLARTETRHVYTIRSGKHYQKIDLDDVLYIRKEGKNCCFYMDGQGLLRERTGIRLLYEKLRDPLMYFLDRGTIVNIMHVWGIRNGMVEMKDGTKLLTKAEALTELFNLVDEYHGKEGNSI